MGYPDLGLISMTEMMTRIAGIVEHAGVPVIADADTGYGNALNARRAVRSWNGRGWPRSISRIRCSRSGAATTMTSGGARWRRWPRSSARRATPPPIPISC